MRNQRTAEERRESALRAAQSRKEHEAMMSPAQIKKLKEKRRENGHKGFLIKMAKRNGSNINQLDWVGEIPQTKQLTVGQKAAKTRKENYEKLSPGQRAAKTRKFRASYRKTVEKRKAFVGTNGNGSPRVAGMSLSVQNNSEKRKMTVNQALSIIESDVRKSVIQELIVMLQEMEKKC